MLPRGLQTKVPRCLEKYLENNPPTLAAMKNVTQEPEGLPGSEKGRRSVFIQVGVFGEKSIEEDII